MPCFKICTPFDCSQRDAQEDAHLIEPAAGNDTSVGVFAVFDGHGGKEVAAFAAMYLVCFPWMLTDMTHVQVKIDPYSTLSLHSNSRVEATPCLISSARSGSKHACRGLLESLLVSLYAL